MLRDDSSERWQFDTTFRMAVERDPAAHWWRRFRWSVERSNYGGVDWRWVGGGRAVTGHRAWALANRRALFSSRFEEGGRTERVELQVVRKHSCPPIPNRPSWAEPVEMEILK